MKLIFKVVQALLTSPIKQLSDILQLDGEGRSGSPTMPNRRVDNFYFVLERGKMNSSEISNFPTFIPLSDKGEPAAFGLLFLVILNSPIA